MFDSYPSMETLFFELYRYSFFPRFERFKLIFPSTITSIRKAISRNDSDASLYQFLNPEVSLLIVATMIC